MKFFLHTLDSPLGTLFLATGSEGEVRALGFSQSRLRRSLAEHYGMHELVDATAPSEAEPKLRRYFAGELEALNEVNVGIVGTDLQRQVWSALRDIPAGEVTSYADLARRLGYDDPRVARDVGAANAANPVAIVVPCHRVIGKDGDLKGYAWGLERKRWLLAYEGADTGDRSTHRLPGL
jgi:methylated-DNA-[protein]-cysteine S-methyltransferase